MSVINKKESLFQPAVVIQPPLVDRLWILQKLDNRVGSVALKILTGAALTLASAAIVTATLSVGWGVIPIIVLVSSVAFAALCLYGNACLKKYHDPTLLAQYRFQASKLLSRMQYLDKMDIVQGISDVKAKEQIKKELIQPLKTLLREHYSLEMILQNHILSPEEFKSAFDLEIKYYTVPEAFKLYQKVCAAANLVKYDLRLFKGEENAKWWKSQFTSYLNQVEPIFKAETISDSNPLGEAMKHLSNIVEMTEGYYKQGFFTEDAEKLKETGRSIRNQLDTYEKFLSRCKHITKALETEDLTVKYYKKHTGHTVVYQEQVRILKDIGNIQVEHEQALKELSTAFNQKCDAIELRQHSHITEKERNGDQEELAFFRKNYEREVKKMKDEFQSKIDIYMDTRLPGEIKELVGTLTEHKQFLEDAKNDYFTKNLAIPVSIFTRANEKTLSEMANTLKKYHSDYLADPSLR